MFCILDLTILNKKGFIPKDHSERFRILEREFLDLYIITDKLFPIYRNSYSTSISHENCLLVKENVERIAKEQKIY